MYFKGIMRLRPLKVWVFVILRRFSGVPRRAILRVKFRKSGPILPNFMCFPALFSRKCQFLLQKCGMKEVFFRKILSFLRPFLQGRAANPLSRGGKKFECVPTVESSSARWKMTSFLQKNIEKMSNRASKMWRKFGVGGAELCSIFAAENGLLSIPTPIAESSDLVPWDQPYVDRPLGFSRRAISKQLVVRRKKLKNLLFFSRRRSK